MEKEEQPTEGDALTWKHWVGLLFLVLAISGGMWLSYQDGKKAGRREQPTNTPQTRDRYAQGYVDGTRYGRQLELAAYCALQAKGKVGDMELRCLKLFLDRLDEGERAQYQIMAL